MIFCGLLKIFKINLFKKFYQEYHQSSGSLDLDQVQHFVGPDLDPNCLQKLSAEDTSMQRVTSWF